MLTLQEIIPWIEISTNTALGTTDDNGGPLPTTVVRNYAGAILVNLDLKPGAINELAGGKLRFMEATTNRWTWVKIISAEVIDSQRIRVNVDRPINTRDGDYCAVVYPE